MFPLINNYPSIEDLPIANSLIEFFHSDYPSSFSEILNELKYDYIFSTHKYEHLVIFFPAASAPPKKPIPYFHRWSYGRFVECDVVCVSDPTLYNSAEMLGGWFMGTGQEWALREIVKRIEELSLIRKYKSVTFSGSSMGGFCAIQAATLLGSRKNTFQTYFVAENPQVSLFDFEAKTPMNLLANVVWGLDSLKVVPNIFHERFDLMNLFSANNYVPVGCAIFKESDVHHFKVHKKILENYTLNNPQLKIMEIAIAEDASGHTPISADHFKKVLHSLIF